MFISQTPPRAVTITNNPADSFEQTNLAHECNSPGGRPCNRPKEDLALPRPSIPPTDAEREAIAEMMRRLGHRPQYGRSCIVDCGTFGDES